MYASTSKGREIKTKNQSISSKQRLRFGAREHTEHTIINRLKYGIYRVSLTRDTIFRVFPVRETAYDWYGTRKRTASPRCRNSRYSSSSPRPRKPFGDSWILNARRVVIIRVRGRCVCLLVVCAPKTKGDGTTAAVRATVIKKFRDPRQEEPFANIIVIIVIFRSLSLFFKILIAQTGHRRTSRFVRFAGKLSVEPCTCSYRRLPYFYPNF